MSKNKRLHVYQDDQLLELTRKWYTPAAWFFLFFTLFWNGIVSIAVTSMLMSGEGFGAVFMIFHVAAGLFLMYYTATLLLNKTYIDVANDELTIHHGPLPWAGNNQRYDIADVEQLYVRQHIRKGKNGTTKSYSLNVVLKDGRHKKIFGLDTLKSEDLKELERYVEEFLGIIDEGVQGEYAPYANKAGRGLKPRRVGNKFAESRLGSVFSAAVGTSLNIKGAAYKIASITQYDWKDGSADRLFQLVDEIEEEKDLFIHQNKALLYGYEENEIPLAYVQTLRFNPNFPSPEFRFENISYQLKNKKTGDKFVTGISQKVAVKEWLYKSDQTRSYIRIIETDGMLTYKRGTFIAPDDINLPLDLNRPPAREIQKRPLDLDEQDFV